MKSNLNNNLLIEELTRISEVMYQLNEQLGQELRQFVNNELKRVVQKEVTTAIRTAIAKDGAEVVKTEIANGTRDLSKAAGVAFENSYKAAQASLGRELKQSEKLALQAEIKKVIQQEQKTIAARETKSLAGKIASDVKTGVKNITAKVKKIFGGGTKELKPTVAKTAEVEKQLAKIGTKEEQELIEGITKKGWNWARINKWGLRLGITAAALWYFFHDNDNVEAPKDIPTDNSNPKGTSGKYTSCPETLPIKQFCKNETVRRVQSCLRMPTKYQTGNFGPITQEYLESRGQNGTTITTETIIAVCGENGLNVNNQTNKPNDVVANKTGYEDYTTDEIETSTGESSVSSAPTSGNSLETPAATTPTAPSSSSSDTASIQRGKQSFINPSDNEPVEQ
jgi:hypothetical protein